MTILQTQLHDAVVESVREIDDLLEAERDLGEWQHSEVIAVDTETTGLDFHDDVRLVQFGTRRKAWVFDPVKAPTLIRCLTEAMVEGGMWVMHNAPFDALHLSKFSKRSAQEIMQHVTDTQILAHLIDPRERIDGGIGHSLKALCAHYVDPDSPDGQTALKARFKELGLKHSEGFAKIPLWDETFVRYAGLDVILTARLLPKLLVEIKPSFSHLINFEHEVQRITTAMTERGMRVDTNYALGLRHDLEQEHLQASQDALRYGVANVNSTQQVADALIQRGVTLTDRTPSGQFKVDKTILMGLEEPLAKSVLAAKEASKASSSWVTPLIDHGQAGGRAHCRIKTLAARTSRMSISNPPLQQLPSNDHRIRSCLIADEGQLLVACDFKQIEFRVLAALSQEKFMIDAILNGEDLHDMTASRLFGSDFTSKHRKLAKGVGFGKVYGGGKATLARQAGVTELEAERALAAFDRSFPRVQRWTRGLIDKCTHGEPLVILPTGREIPLERKFGYRAVNYLIQGLAAEIFKGSLIELHNAGLGDHLLVPVHDEVLSQVRETEAEEFAHTLIEVMSGELGPVPIEADAEVIGRSWGDIYRKETLSV
jgi:DNA polymerase-1